MKKLAFNKNNELVKVCENREQVLDAQVKHLKMIDCSSGDGALQAMLDLQAQFQRRMYNGELPTDTQYIKNHILYAEAEMHEMLRELQYFKEWKTYDWTDEEIEEHRAAAKEEFVDVLHFIWNVALALGLDADEIMQIYADKNITNHLRQDNGY